MGQFEGFIWRLPASAAAVATVAGGGRAEGGRGGVKGEVGYFRVNRDVFVALISVAHEVCKRQVFICK